MILYLISFSSCRYYEDLFARDAKTPVVVSVSSKAYRTLSLYDPGTYTVTLSYYNTQSTVARWTVRKPEKKAKAKNIVFFLADGCPTTAITAARLIGHKQVCHWFPLSASLPFFPSTCADRLQVPQSSKLTLH